MFQLEHVRAGRGDHDHRGKNNGNKLISSLEFAVNKYGCLFLHFLDSPHFIQGGLLVGYLNQLGLIYKSHFLGERSESKGVSSNSDGLRQAQAMKYFGSMVSEFVPS